VSTLKAAIDTLEETVYWASQDTIVVSSPGNTPSSRKGVTTLEERLVTAGKELTVAKAGLEALLHGANLMPPGGEDHIEDT
jgi:hypothetical protein